MPYLRLAGHVFIAALLLGSAEGLWAESTEWVHDPATLGNWLATENWSLGLPTVGLTASINNGGTIRLDGDAVASYVFVGAGGTGTLVHSGGTLTPNSNLVVGMNPGSEGRYEISGSARLEPLGIIEIGSAGEGTLSLLGGEVVAAHLMYVGSRSGGTGMVDQSGGSAVFRERLSVGEGTGSSGVYQLSGTGRVSALDETVGSSGSGAFIQSGGIHSVSGTVWIARHAGSVGHYDLHGGELTAGNIYLNEGQGLFSHSGGLVSANNVSVYGSSRYELSGGDLVVGSQMLLGTGGEILQTGGTHTSHRVRVGFDSGDSRYLLDGGKLAAQTVAVGDSSMEGAGAFVQTAGEAAIQDLWITQTGRYKYSGGSLSVDHVLELKGELDFQSSDATLAAGPGAWVHLAAGNVLNSSNATLAIGADSLLTVPASFNPSTAFAHFSNAGVTYTLGSTLNVPAGTTIHAHGVIADHAVVAGAVLPHDSKYYGQLVFADGLEITGGSVQAGRVKVDDYDSGVNGGELSVGDLLVGFSADGAFTQHEGTVTVTGAMGVGSVTASQYSLKGGTLTAPSLYVAAAVPVADPPMRYSVGRFYQTGGSASFKQVLVGGSGTYELSGDSRFETGDLQLSGVFRQTGGTAVVREMLSTGSTARYELSGGELTVGTMNLNGKFTHTGGWHTITTDLKVADSSSTSGTYAISGTGALQAKNLYVGWNGGSGRIEQSGGMVTAASALYNRNYYGLTNGTLSAPFEQVGRNSGFAIFEQSGGANTTEYLKITPSALYQYRGGTLTMTGGLDVGGYFNMNGQAWSLDQDGMILSVRTGGGFFNAGQASVRLGAHSLLIAPAGFDPAATFGSFENAGLTHTTGSALVVPADRDIRGWADIDDPVEVYGKLTTWPRGFINLSNGLTVHEGAAVEMGSGKLTVVDSPAVFAGGRVSMGRMNVDSSTTIASVTQTGGQVSILGSLTVGPGSSGVYTISGGLLRAASIETGTTSKSELNISGDALVETGYLYIEPWSRFTMSGGHLRATAWDVNYWADWQWTGGVVEIGASDSRAGLVTDWGVGPTLTIGSGQGFIAPGDAKISEARVFKPIRLEEGGLIHIGGDLELSTRLEVAGGDLQFGSLCLYGSLDMPDLVLEDKLLRGTGRFTGKLTNRGTVLVWRSEDGLKVEGDYVQLADGILRMEVGTHGTNVFGGFQVTGEVVLDGLLEITRYGTYAPIATDSFTIIRAASVMGMFANAGSVVPAFGGLFDVVYGADSVTLANWRVPEPGALALVLGLALLRPRRVA